MKLPVYLCLQEADFSTLFNPQSFCDVVLPFLPFPAVRVVASVHA